MGLPQIWCVRRWANIVRILVVLCVSALGSVFVFVLVVVQQDGLCQCFVFSGPELAMSTGICLGVASFARGHEDLLA